MSLKMEDVYPHVASQTGRTVEEITSYVNTGRSMPVNEIEVTVVLEKGVRNGPIAVFENKGLTLYFRK